MSASESQHSQRSCPTSNPEPQPYALSGSASMYYNENIAIQHSESIMSMMSMRLPDELSQQLEALALATGRSKSFLASQAIRDFLERESWQISEITQAIQEANAGDFASDEEIKAITQRWQTNEG